MSNYASTRVASFFGTDADDRYADRAVKIVAADMANAIKLRDAAVAFQAAIKGLTFIAREPASGYAVDDIQAMIEDWAGFDLATYRRNLERDALDFARI
jgi:hypothetical protein